MDSFRKLSAEELEITKVTEEKNTISKEQLLYDKDSLERTIVLNCAENDRVNNEIKEAILEIERRLKLLLE